VRKEEKKRSRASTSTKIEEYPSAEIHAMAKSADEQIEHRESELKGLNIEQDALYQAYASKSPEWHHKMTRTLLRKVDMHLLPFLILMYLLNFLDRK
jgi:hypothetical protein